MPYHLSPHQIEEIESKLPPQYAALKDKYPVAISNAAESWDKPPFPPGYIPRSIDVYYADEADGPDICLENGELTFINLRDASPESTVIQVDINGSWSYIQIEGRVILNRLVGVVLPDVLVHPAVLMEVVLSNSLKEE